MSEKLALNIHHNSNAANDLFCVICGDKCASSVGPALFLSGTDEMVCRECGQKHAPELVRMLLAARADDKNRPLSKDVLLAEYAKRPVKRFYHYAERPRSSDPPSDFDYDGCWAEEKHELFDYDGVNVLISADTATEAVPALMRKLAKKVISDARAAAGYRGPDDDEVVQNELRGAAGMVRAMADQIERLIGPDEVVPTPVKPNGIRISIDDDLPF